MVIALIPARSGSKRILNKNIRLFFGHPLLAYAIQSAIDAEIFNDIYVSSDSDRILEIAEYYGAKSIKRPDEFAGDNSPDSEWIDHALSLVKDLYFYAIIRPTNPFRTGDMIKKGFEQWDKVSIMKAIELVKQHPWKMWKVSKKYMDNYVNNENHLEPTQTFREYYIQNGSLEWRPFYKVSQTYQPFLTQGYEGFDLNTIEDWILAEALVEKGYAKLPEIDRRPYDFTTV